MSPRRTAALLGAFALTVLMLGSAAPTLLTDVHTSPGLPGSATPHVLLPSFASVAAGATDLGPLPNMPLSVGVALSPSDPAAVDQLIQNIYTPGTPEYDHYYTPAEYQAAFSPTSAQVAAVEHYFAGYGVSAQPSGDRLIVSLSGPSNAIGSAFGTSFHRYELAGGDIVYAPASSVLVPSGLDISAGASFSGINNMVPYFLNPPILPNATSPAACSPVSGNSPSELEGQYGETPILSTYNGSGMRVGIVDAYDSAFTQADATSTLTSFSSGCGLAKPQINYLYPTRTTANLNSSGSTGWGGETELDIETVHSMAPGATIDLTLAADSSLAVYEAVDFLVAFNVTNTISMSWGENDLGTGHEAPQNPCLAYYSCNASSDGSYAFLHPVFAEAVAEGISPFGAAGDCGAYDSTSILTTDYPGSDQYVTDVGGTVLNSSGTTYGGESGWSGTGKDCTANTGGGGGGFAPWARPFWQSGEGLYTTNDRRGGPDVSASSADGTSEATPIWAGTIAVADQMHGGDLGLLGPSLYSILRDPTEYASDFHDIVVGNNGYPAGRGWDPVTGIGSPDIQNLLPDLFRYQPPSVGGMTVALTASPGNTAAETFTATVTGGVAPYKYDFVPGLDLGQWAGVNSTLAYTYTGTGAFFASVEVWDADGNWSQSLPVLVDIGSTALTATLTPSTTSTTVGTAVSFTATVTGGTSPYAYTYLWGDGSYGYNASSSDAHAYQAPGTYCPTVEVVDSATTPDGALGTSSCITVTTSSPSPLTISATATPASGTAPLSVGLTSSPTGGTGVYSTFFWHLGDGTTASTQSLTHAYSSAGTYFAWANVTDSGGATAMSNVLTITVSGAPPPLTISATATPTTGTAPLTVDFSSTPSGGSGGNTFSWHFGLAGPVSTSQNPSYTYSTAGTYSAWVNATDSSGTTAQSNVLTITVSAASPLTATASASVTSGTAPLAVSFTGSASGGSGGNTWAWYFGLAGATSTSQDPSYTYANAGAYNAWVNVTDSAGTTVKSNVVTVDVSASSIAVTASANRTSGAAPFSVQFTGSATGGSGTYTSWSWNFGDSVTSTLQDPSHVYAGAGTYTAVLKVTDNLGDTATSAGITITATPSSSAGPLDVTLSGPAQLQTGQNATYLASATGGAGGYTFAWAFGDGTAGRETGSVDGVTHVFSSGGTFEVEVTTTDASGAQKSAFLNVTVAAPSSAPSSGNLFLTNGSLSTLGWLIVLAAVVVVGALAAFAISRRRRAPPSPESAPIYGGLPEWSPPPPPPPG